jgi:hypothetical protein
MAKYEGCVNVDIAGKEGEPSTDRGPWRAKYPWFVNIPSVETSGKDPSATTG